jgi:outer membrane lipoprotein-sorting protein
MKPPRKDAWLGRIGEGRKHWKTFLENLQEFSKKKGVTSTMDKLGDREVMRFRHEADNRTDTLWVDLKTNLPVRMETQLSDPNPDTTRITFLDTEYEWDPPLPKGVKNLDELFSTTPPPGYTLDDQTKS